MLNFKQLETFSKKYEKLWADKIGGQFVEKKGNDQGADVIGPDGKIYDIKVSFPPTFIDHWKYINLEEKQGKNVGWFLDDTKTTTHYVFFNECKGQGPERHYRELFVVERKKLKGLYEAYYDQLQGSYRKDTKERYAAQMPILLIKSICDYYEKGDIYD